MQPQERYIEYGIHNMPNSFLFKATTVLHYTVPDFVLFFNL